MTTRLGVVVGASSDLGVALTRMMIAERNMRVVAHCHAGPERVVVDSAVSPVVADLSVSSAAHDMAERILNVNGVPDCLVYLPALSLRCERFSNFDVEYFLQDFAIQVQSAIQLLKVLAPAMAKQPRARVVFVNSSVTRGIPPRFMSMYTIVKHAQLGLMRALAAEYASTGLTVNAVSPSMVETRFLDGLPGMVKEAAAAANPRGRLASVNDVAGAIMFFLSPQGDYITGTELPVAGGSVF